MDLHGVISDPGELTDATLVGLLSAGESVFDRKSVHRHTERPADYSDIVDGEFFKRHLSML